MIRELDGGIGALAKRRRQRIEATQLQYTLDLKQNGGMRLREKCGIIEDMELRK
jgi:hypothetical protein